jgi:hypothetical protein
MERDTLNSHVHTHWEIKSRSSTLITKGEMSIAIIGSVFGQ